MKKEYTMSSPQQLYPPPQRNQPRINNYGSPKNNNPTYSSFKSPSQRQDEDLLEKKYPRSYKYHIQVPQDYKPQRNQDFRPRREEDYRPRRQQDRQRRQQYCVPRSQQYREQYQSPKGYKSPRNEINHSIEISELKSMINQLKSSLQVCTENSQRIQEELFLQRSKNIQLSEVKRRLEDELKRMEFELERIGNYQSLQTRQSSIKLENVLRENTKLSHQIDDLMSDNKQLRNDQRKLMTECDILSRQRETLLNEKDVLMQQNASLLDRLQNLSEEIGQVKDEIAYQSQKSINSYHDPSPVIPSRINHLQTVRTNQASTIVSTSPRLPISNQSIRLPQLPQQIDYEEENLKLMEDYNKLLEQNESMKQLYNNYLSVQKNENQRQSKPQHLNFNHFSNRKIVDQLSSSRRQHDNYVQEIPLQPLQRQQLGLYIEQVRQSAIQQVLNIYHKAVRVSESQRKNCLKTFMEELLKKKTIFSQIAQNYLQLRSTIQDQTGLKFPKPLGQTENYTPNEQKILETYRSVKQKAKTQNSNVKVSMCLAIFRLLTLLEKAKAIGVLISQHLKHSVLKYLYKMNEENNANK